MAKAAEFGLRWMQGVSSERVWLILRSQAKYLFQRRNAALPACRLVSRRTPLPARRLFHDFNVPLGSEVVDSLSRSFVVSCQSLGNSDCVQIVAIRRLPPSSEPKSVSEILRIGDFLH